MSAEQLKPQPGPQSRFLESTADICIYGGAAGAGKSFGLLLECLYHIGNPKFRALLLRRTSPQLRMAGGLYQESQSVFPLAGAVANETNLVWRFPSGSQVKLGQCEHPNDVENFRGGAFDLIGFDELSQFDERTFWFLLSRARSVSGIKPYIRCGTNPTPDGWLRSFVDWWIGPDGYPIPERSGVLRWFLRSGDSLVWADTEQELVQQFPGSMPKSATFIGALVTDNRILMAKDPSYLANLDALPEYEKSQFRRGNWNSRLEIGSMCRREWLAFIDTPPADVVSRCRFFDRAASELRVGTDPDSTATILVSKDKRGLYTIEHASRHYLTPLMVERLMINYTETDPPNTVTGFMCDPGSAGKAEAAHAVRLLDGHLVQMIPSANAGSKEIRFKLVSSQMEAGNVRIVRGPWNDDLLKELEGFPLLKHDDFADALSGAFEVLRTSSRWEFSPVQPCRATAALRSRRSRQLAGL